MAKDSTIPPAPVVLYDGDCGMCHRGVRFILRKESAPTLRFAACDSDFAKSLPGFSNRPDSMAFAQGAKILFRSDAALAVCEHLRAPWRWLRILRFLPKGLRDALYDFVAKRRHRWFSKPDSACPVPDTVMRGRFLR